MIHEFRQYWFDKEGWDNYWILFNNLCMPLRRDDFGILKGKWLSFENETIRFVHLWEYESLEDRARLRADLLKVDEWRNEFLPKAASHISKQLLKISNPKVMDFSIGMGDGSFNLYEISCRVGKGFKVISELEKSDYKKLLWSSEFSDPNEVIMMKRSGGCLSFKNLEKDILEVRLVNLEAISSND